MNYSIPQRVFDAPQPLERVGRAQVYVLARLAWNTWICREYIELLVGGRSGRLAAIGFNARRNETEWETDTADVVAHFPHDFYREDGTFIPEGLLIPGNGWVAVPQKFWPEGVVRGYLRRYGEWTGRGMWRHLAAAVAPVDNRGVYWCGCNYRRRMSKKEAYRELGKAVREAIAEGECVDTDPVFEALNHVAELMGHGGIPIASIRNALSDKAGWDVDDLPVLCGCGHVERQGCTHSAGGFSGVSMSTVCDHCFEDDCVYVEDQGTHAFAGDVYEHSDGEYYSYPERDEDDEDDEDEDSGRLMRYDVNVLEHLRKDRSFETSPAGDFHMGVELETVSTSYDDVDYNVREILDGLGRSYVVCKRDGSIGDAGIEIVTQPTSLAMHLAKFGAWEPEGLKAWNAGCCGMHVHIDSKAFTALTLGKFIAFFNRAGNETFIRQIAGRHPEFDQQAAEYATYDVDKDIAACPLKTLKNKPSSRYVMVNTTNLNERESTRLGMERQCGSSNTVEVRIFRASLRKERLLAQLEFTHALVLFCRQASYKKLDGATFIRWLHGAAGMYRNLAKWYGINHRHGTSKHGRTPSVVPETTETMLETA